MKQLILTLALAVPLGVLAQGEPSPAAGQSRQQYDAAAAANNERARDNQSAPAAPAPDYDPKRGRLHNFPLTSWGTGRGNLADWKEARRARKAEKDREKARERTRARDGDRPDDTL